MQRRIAYCEVPKLAGVYTFAVNLARHLPQLGYDLRLVGVGPQARADYARSLSVLPAEVVGPDAVDVASQRDALVGWLRKESIDIVMISGSEAEHRLVPTLPASIRVVSVVNNATRGHYRVATYGHERMHRLVCVSPRLAGDVINHCGVPADKVQLIPYGIDAEACTRDVAADAARDDSSPLRLLYLGRMCESAKGIFLIPRILARLERAGVPFHLTTIGDGPDSERFASLMNSAGPAARWTHRGAVRYDALPAELVRHDVQLLPSRHEGLPLTLLEGMAAGCVPVASRLAGITDYAIASPDQGFLCHVGRATEFASAIASLAADRSRLRRMSAAATARIAERFTREQMAVQYAELFDTIMTEPPIAARSSATIGRRSLSLGPVGFTSWRRIIPAPIKNAIRTACEQVGWTV